MFVVQDAPRQAPMRPGAPRPPARWGTVGLALGAGLAAALLAFLLVRGRIASGASAPALVSVVVAAQDIPARTRLNDALLQVRAVPPAEVPDGAVKSRADLAGKILLHPIAAGKAVTTQAVAAPGVALGMAFALPPNQRAVTVALDPADGVDEFARPGDHVDILATDEPGSGSAETRTVLQNVALLAVGTQTSADDAPAPPSPAGSPSASHVTVAVSPVQAQALVLASVRGKIHLALRSADDTGVVSLPVFPAPVPMQEAARPAPLPPSIRPRPKPAAEPEWAPLPLPPLTVAALPPRPVRVTITVIKGSQSQTVSVAP